jgi:hypothetical protein
MRTTVDFDPDVEKAIAQMRRRGGGGLSDAVNALIRQGLRCKSSQSAFTPIVRDLGITIDVSNISDTLDLLEGPNAR